MEKELLSETREKMEKALDLLRQDLATVRLGRASSSLVENVLVDVYGTRMRIMELAIIRNHHERWDGNGYPDGLMKENIPKLSRILSVADSFDAMNSNRAYRESLPFSVCIDELKRNSGTQFDPEVVEAALAIFSSSPVFPH